MKYLPRAVADGKLRALVKGAEIVRAELAGYRVTLGVGVP